MGALRIQRQCNEWYFLQPLTQTDSLHYIIFCSGPRACLCLCMPYPHAVLRLPQLQLPAERELGATSHCPPEPDPGRGQSASSRLLPETALWRLGERLTQRWRETALVRARVLREGEISLPMEDRPKAQGIVE